jgi:4-amino-4-deoxychorismate lyase
MPNSRDLIFLETIKWDGERYRELSLHQERLTRTFRKFFGASPGFNLAEALPASPGPGLRKARLTYSANGFSATIEPYVFPAIKNAALVSSDLSYGYKFLDRSEFSALKAKSPSDEIIVVKDGLLTDSSIANLVFSDKRGELYTPDPPLLPGVKRASLIASGKIKRKKIRPEDLEEYVWLWFINAMIDLEDGIRIPVSSISREDG